MRFDTPIYFQRITAGKLNTETHNYDDDVIVEVKRYADVTDSGVETLNLVYGEIKQGSKTVRIQRAYNEPFDRIRIGDKTYRVDLARRGKSFVVSEVQ